MIHILDAHAANQIAAGEVIERPASVVKELVENAIDSGAKHIDITVEGNGVPLIRVRDDGSGIASADLPLAVIRHATSKIRQIEDLDQLRTLGFRGEALPSIASVSQMEISSRPDEQVAGLSLKIKGGEQEELKEVGCPVGTSVTIQNLFYNTPARLKFLKSTPTEFGLISDTIGRIALAHPEIAFSLTHPQQVVLQTSGRGEFRETIGSILGHTIARQLIPINLQQETWSIEGFISPPNLVRSSKQTQIFMINGRSVRSTFLSRALQEGYHTLIPVKLYPIVVLHLHVPPSDYDVNVHPTKMDVRFKHEQALNQFISQTVYQTLIDSKPLPSFETAKSIPSLIPKMDASQPNPSSSIVTRIPPNPTPISASTPTSISKASMQIRELAEPLLTNAQDTHPHKPLVFDQEKTFATPPQRPGVAQSELVQLKLNIETSVGESTSITQNVLSHIWPLAQLFNTYILATDGETLFMIDQHAAHERINYERLLREFKQAEQASQALLIPLPMEFTLQEEQVLLEHLWILNEMGFILEQFGSRTYLLRGVPAQTGTYQPDQLLREFIEEVLLKNTAPNLDKLLEEWIYLLACKESIKAQDTLSLLEIEQLIAQLNQTQNPYTCPHGRPTMIKMTRMELEKRFYRT
ncbi:DNA mismatch repair protein MutL [Desulfosporosinus sp. I2]|nr:DNA mismatch repair protein MutL [Desulfosporosinus sp. I2]